MDIVCDIFDNLLHQTCFAVMYYIQLRWCIRYLTIEKSTLLLGNHIATGQFLCNVTHENVKLN